MIEVFKTNVTKPVHAAAITTTIRSVQNAYQVNFDLDDCDCIMRVKSTQTVVDTEWLIGIVRSFGFEAQLLVDEGYHPSNNTSNHKQLL